MNFLSADQLARERVAAFQRKHRIGLLVLLFTDVVGSVEMKQILGDIAGSGLVHEHHAAVRSVLATFAEAEEINVAGDGFFIVFTRASDAVTFALRLQALLRTRKSTHSVAVQVRIGIHAGEVLIGPVTEGERTRDIFGIQVDTAARLMSLGGADQILLTQFVYENARTVLLKSHEADFVNLAWMHHGRYLLKGIATAIDVFEVGESGHAALAPPADNEKAVAIKESREGANAVPRNWDTENGPTRELESSKAESELINSAEPNFTMRLRARGCSLNLALTFALAACAIPIFYFVNFYTTGHPENPKPYALHVKLHKIESPRRFEVSAAPLGEFLTAQRIFERYSKLTPLELVHENDRFIRDYLKNYRETKKLVPYVTGRYVILNVSELSSKDMFPSGMVALAQAADFPQVLIEYVYPASPKMLPALRATLQTGNPMKIERTNDLVAVLHVEKTVDGRLLFTVVPLLYGNYGGSAAFSLEPPQSLNLVPGFPIIKSDALQKALQKSSLPHPGN